MHNTLQSLELQGFKSFAGKTVFEFPARVTAIVGPNGSGKSNVIDAFRWVLGEREAKQLRGASLDNLIFAGTPKRPAVGYARVALSFDNRARLFDQDETEVTVSRRVDRSGTSEYSLNGGEVRLRDLVPILARAKLGARGLTMIGQGQSDLFVRSSPMERREMIEEVLGLREYRLKKSQAERRLDSSRVNMEKVQAMLEELAPHLRLLRRQKHRWDKRADVEAELIALERSFFAARYHALKRALAAASAPLETLTGTRSSREQAIAKLEREVKALDAASVSGDAGKALRASLAAALDKKSAAERELAKLEAKLEFEASRPAEGAEQKSHAEALFLLREAASLLKQALALDSHEAVKTSLAELHGRLEAFLAVRKPSVDASLTAQAEMLRASLASLTAEVAKLRAEEEEELKRREELQCSFRGQVEALEKERSALRTLDQEIQGELLRKERSQLQFSELEHEWHTLGKPKEELHALPEPAEPVEREEAERRLLRLRGELLAIGEIDEAVVKEATEVEERHAFLTRELEDLTVAVRDLKNLIRELEHRIHEDFKSAFRAINDEFNNYFRLMFGGGKAKLKLVTPKPKEENVVSAEGGEAGAEGAAAEPAAEPAESEPEEDPELQAGIEVDLSLPRKRITSLEMLSGGEKSLVSIAALFALIAVSPPPFLVLDEVDAPLDEQNARRFAELIRTFAEKSQFIIVTHNRATMEAADVLYGVTMGDDGVSKVLSLKLEGAA